MEKQKWINSFIAASVFIVIFGGYLKTLAPTVVFWDCGEFIATSHILGVPHPPGTPLYVLLGRIFDLLPFGSTTSVKVNMMTALFSALTSVFFYLVVVRIVRLWQNEPYRLKNSIVAYTSGITASFYIAFSYTNWACSTAAEVYAVSAFTSSVCCWLILRWKEKLGTKANSLSLLLIIYLISLSIAVHLTTLLLAPSLLLYVLLVDRRQVFNTKIICWSLLLLVIGLSVHLYLPIRSKLNPAIDEANPETWKELKAFILREQYGQTSIFDRRASWGFQLSMYWKYFIQQYNLLPSQYFPAEIFKEEKIPDTQIEFYEKNFVEPYKILPSTRGLVGWLCCAIPLLLGVLGIVTHFRMEKYSFTYFGTLFLITSLGLIIYLNFTDHEVRDRDYFYAPSFIFYALWIGIGSGELTRIIGNSANNIKNNKYKIRDTFATGVTGGMMIICSWLPFFSYYHEEDYTDNYIAYDYGYNILNSVDENGIIFTNGDNDTFPLWFLQEVEGVRQDVSVINLSLLNTPWYVYQLKHSRNPVPMSFTDEQIEQLRPIGLKDGSVLLVKDIVMRDIIMTNRWRRPIYLAVTLSPENMRGYENYLSLEGLAFRLVSKKGTNQINVEVCENNIWRKYRYRSILNDLVYKDQNTRKLLSNYSAAFIRLGYEYLAGGNLRQAISNAQMAVRISPDSPRLKCALSKLYLQAGWWDYAESELLTALEIDPENAEIYSELGALYERKGKLEDAIKNYQRSITYEPYRNPLSYGRLFQIYCRQGEREKAISVLEEWIELHPTDSSAIKMLDEYKSEQVN